MPSVISYNIHVDWLYKIAWVQSLGTYSIVADEGLSGASECKVCLAGSFSANAGHFEKQCFILIRRSAMFMVVKVGIGHYALHCHYLKLNLFFNIHP